MKLRRFPLSGIVLLAVSGCGAGSVEVPDRAAFDTAVMAYLEQRSMNLAIADYESFDPGEDGSSATAVIALVLAGEGVSRVKTRFRFTFHRVDGQWQAVSHQKVKI